jgi:hypothetical protein
VNNRDDVVLGVRSAENSRELNEEIESGLLEG